jgi:hypothetical protein
MGLAQEGRVVTKNHAKNTTLSTYDMLVADTNKQLFL